MGSRDLIPVDAFTAGDLAAIEAAHAVLTRIGNSTAAAGQWNEYIDRAHQDLGLILAVRAAADAGA